MVTSNEYPLPLRLGPIVNKLNGILFECVY